MNLCSKPGCGHTGAVILTYEYSRGQIVLDDPAQGEISPHAYAMCMGCAEKLKPPRGWTIDDRRESPPLFLDEVAAARVAREAQGASDEPDVAGRQLFFGSSI